MGCPDFLVIGVQKGGTSSLFRLLANHPGVFLPAAKELQFFSLHYGRGWPWYAQHFADAKPGQCCGEATPYYVFHPPAMERIAADCPAVKLIVLLRDPVERALSQYFHSVRLGQEPLGLEQALAAEPERLAGAEQQLRGPPGRHRSHQEHSYVSRSRYGPQLERLHGLFAADQLLLLRTEDLFGEAAGLCWQRLQRFLGVEVLPLPPLPLVNAGRGEAAGVAPELRRALRQELAPTYSLMAERYGLHWPA